MRASAPHLAPPSVSARRSWLSSLSALLHEHEQDIVQALHDDLKRPATESLAAEIWPLMHEVQDAHDSLEAWAKPTKANTNWLWMATGPKVVKVPKGAVLIIGAWNCASRSPTRTRELVLTPSLVPQTQCVRRDSAQQSV